MSQRGNNVIFLTDTNGILADGSGAVTITVTGTGIAGSTTVISGTTFTIVSPTDSTLFTSSTISPSSPTTIPASPTASSSVSGSTSSSSFNAVAPTTVPADSSTGSSSSSSTPVGAIVGGVLGGIILLVLLILLFLAKRRRRGTHEHDAAAFKPSVSMLPLTFNDEVMPSKTRSMSNSITSLTVSPPPMMMPVYSSFESPSTGNSHTLPTTTAPLHYIPMQSAAYHRPLTTASSETSFVSNIQPLELQLDHRPFSETFSSENVFLSEGTTRCIEKDTETSEEVNEKENLIIPAYVLPPEQTTSERRKSVLLVPPRPKQALTSATRTSTRTSFSSLYSDSGKMNSLSRLSDA